MSSIEVVTVGKHRVAVQRIGNDPNHDNVILVNGALATTKSFRQVARSLCDDFNMLMYDLPYSGMSRPHNDSVGVLTKDGLDVSVWPSARPFLVVSSEFAGRLRGTTRHGLARGTFHYREFEVAGRDTRIFEVVRGARDADHQR